MNTEPERKSPTSEQTGRALKKINGLNTTDYSKMIENAQNKTQRAALKYARFGWSVFPLREGDKRPATRDGFKSATTDPQQLNQWFQHSALNVGIATGNGLFVFDLDNIAGKDGQAVLSALQAEHGPLPDTLTAQTQSGGKHLFFSIPFELNLRNSTDLFSDTYGGGLDVRCNGGYVVAAPSRTAKGCYQWISKPALASLPEHWISLLQQPEREQAAQQAQRQQMQRARIERLIPGQISVIAEFNACYDVRAILQNHGYTGKGNRYQSPNSTSGLAGVVVMECADGLTRCYSHHGSDPLSNAQANDAFDVFCLLEHGGNRQQAIQAAGLLLFTATGETVTAHNRSVYQCQQYRNALDHIPANDLNTVCRVARACRSMPDGFDTWKQWAGQQGSVRLWRHLEQQPAFKPGYLLHLAQQTGAKS